MVLENSANGVVWTECLCLPPIHMLKPNPQCDDIRSWGFRGDQVMRDQTSAFLPGEHTAGSQPELAKTGVYLQ